MVANFSRREILGTCVGAVGGAGATLVAGSADSDSTDRTEHEPPPGDEQESYQETEPGTGKVDTHVIEEGSHRGANSFSYFLDRASLGLDADQPDEVYSRIYVKFDSTWEQPMEHDTCKIYWAGGNLSAGPAGQGGFRPSGDDGWSVRVYTRGPVTDGAVSFGTYVYHLDQSGPYGELWGWPDRGRIGTWNQIDTYVKLNSVGADAAYDGIVRMWLNGSLQQEHSNFRWRTTEELGFDRLGPGSYWGGSVASPRHNIIYYDNFRYAVGAEGFPQDGDGSS